eukprot:scaffold2535_cov109-Skeletonema_marinoi.AAC.5
MMNDEFDIQYLAAHMRSYNSHPLPLTFYLIHRRCNCLVLMPWSPNHPSVTEHNYHNQRTTKSI